MPANVATLTAKLTLDDSGFKSGLNNADKESKSFQEKASASFGKMQKAASLAFVAVGAAAVGTAVKSVAAFAGFEKGMNEVFTLLPGISEDAMDEMSDQVKDLSKTMGILPEDAIPAVYQALSAGVPQDNVFDFMETAGKAAIGGATDLETAVDGLTSTVNAYGADVISAGEASDLMFTAVRLGKTTMDELSRSLFQVNPAAAALGISFGDVTAALAAMTAQGTPTSVATTQLRQALVELGKQGTAAFQHFERATGQTFPEFIEGGGNVEEAFQAMKGEADELGVGVGDLFGSVEAGMGVISLTSDSGAEAFGKAMDEMQSSAGATDEAFATMDQGLSRTWDKIKAQVAVALVEIGERLAPFVQEFASWFEDTLPSAIDFTISAVESIVGFIKNFIEGFKTVKGAFDDMPDAAKKAAVAIGLISAALLALSAHPVVAGLGIVAGLVALIGSNANDAKGRVDTLKGSLGELGDAGLNSFITDQLTGDMEFLGRQLQDVGVSFGSVTEAVRGTKPAFDEYVKSVTTAMARDGESSGYRDKVKHQLWDLFEAYEDAASAIRSEADQLVHTNRMLGKSEELSDKATLAQNRFRKEADKVTTTLDDDLNRSLGDSGIAAEDFFLEMEAGASIWQEAIDKEVGQVINGFNELPDATKLSIDEFNANLRDNTLATDQWQADLQTITEAGMTRLAGVLANGGIEMRDLVSEMANNMNGALEAELNIAGILAPEITNFQEILDSVDMTDMNATLATFRREFGLSQSQAKEMYDQILKFQGLDVRFSVSGTWNLPPPPAGFLPQNPIWISPGGGGAAMHDGGVVDGPPGTDEVWRVLQKGEGVVDRETMQSGFAYPTGSSGGDTHIYIDGNVYGIDDLVDVIENGRRQRRMRGGVMQ